MSINTMQDLREFLIKDLERVSAGEITPAVCNASSNISGKILQSIKLEVEYNAMIGAKPQIDFLNGMSRKMKKLNNIINAVEAKD